MQRAGIISQVRMGSTRLPSKVLLPAAGRPLLDYHVARAQQSGLPIYLATTTEPADDVLAAYAETNDIPYHRGSEADVLARYYETAQKFGLDIIVRVTSDCPLVDGPLIGAAVARYLEECNPLVYRSNSIVRPFPRGLDFEIFSMEMLAEAYANATLPYEREHVTPYIKANPAMVGRVVYRDEVWPGGDFDLNVVIRSLQYRRDTGYLSFQVGSAITHDSVPELEYQECLLKARAILEVLESTIMVNSE